MLLLVVQSQHGAPAKFVPLISSNGGNERFHVLIHMCAVAVNILHRGSPEQAALRARKWLAHGFIIGIEQKIEVWVKRFVVFEKRIQYERLEKPSRMREVPLRRADLGHRLYAVVLCREWLANIFRLTSDRTKPT